MSERVEILGVGVDRIGVEGLHCRLLKLLNPQRPALVLNVNAHALNLACSRPWLWGLFNEAEVVFCDGAGVSLAARLLGYGPLERITYAEEIWALADFAARQNLSLFLLGAKPGVARRAASNLRRRFPSLKIVGTMHGYFPADQAPEVVRQINSRAPDLLLVGMGMPAQERWAAGHRHELHTGAILTVGAAFDYASGDLRRGPKLLYDNGFEWLARLLVEPRRLWRRYLLGNPLFVARVVARRVGLLRPADR